MKKHIVKISAIALCLSIIVSGMYIAQVRAETVSLQPVADAVVYQSSASSNHGTKVVLEVETESGGTDYSYLKYDLRSHAGKTLTGAVLRLRTTSDSDSGTNGTVSIRLVADTSWTETGITYNNRPTISSTVLGTMNPTSSNTLYSTTLNASQLQSAVGGYLSLGLTGSNDNVATFHSRETNFDPELVLTFAAASPSPTPSPTPTPTVPPANVSFDRSSSPAPQGTGTSLMWQHTTGNFQNRLLLVGVNLLGADNVTVSYNGVPLTRLTTYSYAILRNVQFWYLKNPPIGTYTVSVQNASSPTVLVAGAAAYYNVDQTNTFGTPATSGTQEFSLVNRTVTKNVTVSNTNTNQLIVDTYGFDPENNLPAPPPITVGTGQSQRWFHYSTTQSNINGSMVDDKFSAVSSSKPGAAGSTTMSYTSTNTATYTWGHIAVPLNLATATAAPTATPPPSLGTGNVINLNFGISNLYPWVQTICGDFRMDNGIENRVPTGQSALITNTTCNTPGIAFTGDSSADFGTGQTSTTNQVVGGSLYPEVYTPSNIGGIFSSYTYLNQKSQAIQEEVINLQTVCPNLANCTLPNNLSNGIYKATGNVQLNANTFRNNSNYVFLIDGNLSLNGNILVPQGSTALFSVSGDIIIPATVGNTVSNNSANLSGIFSTDQSFIMQSNGNCNDLRLNIEGTLIVNATQSGGRLQNNRTLCGNNATTPVLQLTQRLDFALNMPEFLKIQRLTTEEAAP